MAMKLVYITTVVPTENSAEAFFAPEIREIARRGVSVLVVPRSGRVSSAGDGERDCLGETLVTPLFSIPILAAAFMNAVLHRVRVWRILYLLFRSRDLGVFLKNLAVLPKGLWLAGKIRQWGADHIHAQWTITTATMALVTSEFSGIPWSVTAHRGDIVENNLLSEKVNRAAFVRFISRSGMDLARPFVGESSLKQKATLIHMGIEVPASGQLSKDVVGTRRGKGVVLCAANFLPVKGHEVLVRAVHRLRSQGIPVMLWLAGQGPVRSSIVRLVQTLDIETSLRFLGQVPHNELVGYYSRGEVDVFVLPSLDLGGGLCEGIPVSLIEAMARGVPVVSTTTGGISELLHGGAGVLVPPGDPIALADAIAELLRDNVLYSAMAQVGRDGVVQEFHVQKVVSALMGRLTFVPSGGGSL
jgi:colanic acid/amylovoran biosynthesis glycosyltransferase